VTKAQKTYIMKELDAIGSFAERQPIQTTALQQAASYNFPDASFPKR
jgi:hypothetical protein